MRWYFRLVDKNRKFYIYAYSRETEDLDGLISFDVEKQTLTMMRPAKLDNNSKNAQRKALEHFGLVVEEGFPDERYVCCG